MNFASKSKSYGPHMFETSAVKSSCWKSYCESHVELSAAYCSNIVLRHQNVRLMNILKSNVVVIASSCSVAALVSGVGVILIFLHAQVIVDNGLTTAI